MKKWIVIPALLLIFLLAAPAHAAEEEAKDVTGNYLLDSYPGIAADEYIFDNNTVAPTAFSDGAAINMSRAEGIGSLYLVFNKEYGGFSVTDLDTGETREFGKNGFLHEFANLEEAFGRPLTKLRVTFDHGSGQLNEMRVLSPGKIPAWVQVWELPKEGETDIVLFSTHGDDEQLFFAGLMPFYAREKGLNVQVVYMTNHRNLTYLRAHEMLDGLWAVGMTSYPVFGPFPDQQSSSPELAWKLLRDVGISREELLEFVVEQLRRFKPMVAVGHDLQGEYGHGQHMIYAETLTRAVEITNDPAQFPESAEAYGVWDVPKTYLHLYPENAITMDWDQPLESFGGMTAFQVTQKLGYPCHKSQFWDFAWYLAYARDAASVTQYSPCSYGLYRSTVGPDVQKNDFMENLKSHVQRKAEEEAARQAAEEAAKKAAEEDARLEAERLEQERKAEEERLRQEQLRLEKEKQLLQLQQEAARQEQQRRRQLTVWGFAGALTVLVLLGVLIARLDKHKNKF